MNRPPNRVTLCDQAMKLVEVCPYCGGEYDWVLIQAKPEDPNKQPTQRRQCEKCGRPWTLEGKKSLEVRTKNHIARAPGRGDTGSILDPVLGRTLHRTYVRYLSETNLPRILYR